MAKKSGCGTGKAGKRPAMRKMADGGAVGRAKPMRPEVVPKPAPAPKPAAPKPPYIGFAIGDTVKKIRAYKKRLDEI